MKTISTFFFSLFLCFLIAQPTVTKDWAPQIGQTLSSQVAAEAPDPGEAGANKTWNFAEVIPNDTLPAFPFTYVDPAGTPFASDFPTATLALTTMGINTYSYSRVTDDKIEMLGNGLEGTGFLQTYSDPITEIVFPFTFGSTFQDTFAGIAALMGIQTTNYGHKTVEADAYGTLVLPNGSFEDVLRIKTEMTQTDSVAIGGGVFTKAITTSTNYVWIDQANPGSLANHTTSQVTSITVIPFVSMDTTVGPEIMTFAYDPSAITSNLTELANQVRLKYSPNPVKEQLNLSFELQESDNWIVQVISIEGRIVYQDQILLNAGVQNLSIPLNVIPGQYIMRVESKQSGVFTAPLIKIE